MSMPFDFKIKHLLRSKYLLDFIRLSFGFIFSSLFSIFTISLINRSLSPDQLGRFSYYKSLFELLVTFLSFDIFAAYLRFNSSGVNQKFYSFSRRFSLILFLILFVLFYLLTSSFYASLFSFIVFFNERNYFYRSILATFKFNLSKALPAIMTLIVLLLCIKLDLLNYELALFSYAIGYFICYFLFIKKDKVAFSDTIINTHDILKFCIPGSVLSIVSWLLSFSSQVIIKNYYGFSELAAFSVSQRALLSIKLFSGLFITFFPVFYYREFENRNFSLVKKVRGAMVVLLIIIISLLFIFAKYIYILLGARSYLETVIYFRIQLISEFFFIITNFYAMYFSYKLQTFKSLVIYGIGSMVNLFLLLIFIKDLGIIFACYSSLISSFLIFILVYYYSYCNEYRFTSK